MRAGLLRLAAILLPLILTACGDLPTTQAIPDLSDAGPALSGECTKQGDGTYLCPPISSDPGGGDECDPYHYDCGGGDCIASTGPGSPEESTVQGCTGGGGTAPSDPGDIGGGGGGGGMGGGGGTKRPPPCPEFDPECGTSEQPQPDTCNTGEQIVDAPDVSGQFQELWIESKLKGVEKGGWVVWDGSSYRLVPFVNAQFTACGIDVYEPPPSGTVSLVHTHPWPLWQTTPCGYVNTGTPSPEDIQALHQTGLSTGYFLDETGIGKFTATGGDTATRIGRCGY